MISVDIMGQELIDRIKDLEIDWCPDDFEVKVNTILKEYFVGRSVKEAKLLED